MVYRASCFHDECHGLFLIDLQSFKGESTTTEIHAQISVHTFLMLIYYENHLGLWINKNVSKAALNDIEAQFQVILLKHHV